ncbi:hypothetical protein CMV_027537 [Castanea mollissima]|uniref:Rx N-terminal domain-containing protein n=1 Tax=Castanea mollissima TaxID=60419 RepID=A0A8J4VD36_9ROSI|nr:hypothetical protein CMV_027537 [Castanea mollissima]
MSVIGDAALSAFFGKLFEKLTSDDLLKFFQQEKVDADLKRWRTTLLKIHAVLDDAEEKQMTNRLVKIWLDELEDLAYDVDDILDEFATEALRRKLNPEPSTSKVRKIFDACIGSNRSFATSMRSKIEEIDTRLQNIVTDKKDLELRENTGGTTRTTRSRVPTTSLVNEGHVYGREEDKKAIVKLLLSGESSDAQLSVIPILAQWAARGLCYRLENILDKQFEISTKVRHFSYIRSYYEGMKKFEDFPKDMHLRTFLPLPIKDWGYLTNYIPNCWLPQLRCLRVLSLCGYEIVELPSSIGDLKHLRYLNLSNTRITSLPESTTSLYNLQTLLLKGCNRLIKLPEKIGNLLNLRHLDITYVNSIGEMPTGIKELKSLQTLSDFVVGKDTASKIGDLMNLESLRGTLRISNLENVLDVEDARRANLIGKKNLDALVMKWKPGLDDLQVARSSLDILEMLRPWTTVKEISIDGYVGAKFPTWFGHPSFSNMVLLRIERCEKCTSLPAIGQLPSLRDLALVGLSAVEIIGLEFYGEDCPKPFQSLETLCFEDMQEWKDWIPCKVEYEEFPCLRELSISQCPKLQGKLPHHVPLLEKFSVNGCEQLDVSIPNFPNLHTLEIKGCKGVVSRSTDELCFPKSTILSIPYVKSLTEEFMHGLAKVENLTIDNCKELTSLWQDEFKSLITLDIRGCSSLVNISLTSTLRTLNIEDCSGLKSLSISNCTCLEKASIGRCNSLTLISRGQLPQNLKTLNISDCENLQFLADEGEASSNSSSLLEDLSIRHCPSLKCLSSSGDLPTTLKRLQIESCKELTSLSSKNELPTSLKDLYVNNCPKMESIANNLPNNASLEYLRIGSCAELKSLPVGLHKLCHLNKISIWSCPSFVSFPDGGLFPTSLRELLIDGCEKLEAWPNCMPNLNSLLIFNCPSVIYFLEEGYPTSLTSLSFGGENICKQVTVWGLHRLTSLTSLRIDGGIPDWQSFPDEQDGKLTMTLPSSLTQLSIWRIPNIVILSSLGFQNLSALEQLYIRNCPKLASLPEKGLPPSLLQLDINGLMGGLSMSWRRGSNKKIVKQRAIFTHNSYSFLPVLQQRLASELLNVLLEFQNMEVICRVPHHDDHHSFGYLECSFMEPCLKERLSMLLKLFITASMWLRSNLRLCL